MESVPLAGKDEKAVRNTQGLKGAFHRDPLQIAYANVRPSLHQVGGCLHLIEAERRRLGLVKAGILPRLSLAPTLFGTPSAVAASPCRARPVTAANVSAICSLWRGGAIVSAGSRPRRGARDTTCTLGPEKLPYRPSAVRTRK